MSEIIQRTNTYNKYYTYFKQKEIGTFIESFLSQQVNKILEDLNNSYENGDIRNCNEIIRKINENRLFKIFSPEKRIILLDLIIKKILPNLICSSNNILNFLTKIRFLIPKNYIINWKFFYSFYYILYNKYRQEIADFIPLFKSLHKFIPLNSFSNEDYNIVKKTFIEDLYNSNKSYAISIFMYFLPKKYIEEDCDLQYKLFLLFKNCKNYFVGSCCMFAKILKKNGKLFFDKTPEKNKELIKIFIKYFFTNLNLYIIDDSSIKNSSYSSPMFHNSDKNKKKNKFDHSVIDVLLYLIFNTNLEEYSELILSNLKLILSNKHLYIKEKSNSNVAKNFIKFITEFIHRLFNSVFYTKKFEEEINKKIKQKIEYNKNTEFIFNKLLDVIQVFNICFKKLFLYDNEGTFSPLQKLFNFIGNIESDKFMEKIVKNIDFNEYIKMLKFFMENIETKSVKFINKLQIILPFLLSEYIYTHYPEVKEFIKDVIILSSNSISSANINFDVNILIMYATYFFDIKNKVKEKKVYESLIPLITDASIKIMDNIIGFIDLICIKNNSEFKFFINSMKHFLEENNKNSISRKYADYIQNYEIESKYLKYYFNVIDKKEHEYIFNYVYNNMIYVDNSNDVKINEYFLYPEKDEDLKINVKYCSLEIFEKQISKYQNIIAFLDFSKILTSEKNIKRFYQLYFTLINKEETNFKRLGIILFKTFINSFINSKIKEIDNEIIIEYPSKENLILLNNVYKKIISPYEKYIKENLNDNNKIENKKKIEQIIFIYIMLIYVISETKLNLILLLLNQENMNNLDNIGIDYINLYKEYLTLISNSEDVIKQIYEYNKGEILNDLNISFYFDKIIINKLNMNSGEMTEKRTLLKEKKSFLFNYYHLSTIKNYWLKKKIKVMNFNYFSLLKNFIMKDKFYYESIYIYAKNITAVNKPSNVISYAKQFLYCLDKDKIKEIYEKIYLEYKQELANNIKEESETEKNKMKNISDVFFDFSFVFTSLFPKDIIPALIKQGNIYANLKTKKFNNTFENLIKNVLIKIKSLIYLPICSEKNLKKIFDKYIGRNDIISEELGNININEKIKQENKIYYEIIKQILNFVINIFNDEKGIIKLFMNENTDKNINIINDREKMFIFFRLKEYIIDTLDKNDKLYQKIIKTIFDIIFSKFIPVSSKYMWMKILHSFIKDEYNSYKTYNYIKYKTEEEFNNSWKDLKYKLRGKKKKEILPVYKENMRFSEFKYEKEKDDKVKYYNINIGELIEIMKQMDEWVEEKSLINTDNVSKFREFLKKFRDFTQENKGLDIKNVKIFYYLLELNYIEFNDYIKNYKFPKSNKTYPVIYEFLLAKYFFMLNKNMFTSETKKELWEIMNLYTNGANKKEDEKIITFFKLLFNICSLEQILLIFDKNDIEFHIDFVSKLFNIYISSFSNLKAEKNIFDKNYIVDIINKIFENDGNLILYASELKHIIKVYLQINNYLYYDHNLFEEKYNKKEIINFFINTFISKDFSKRSRYTLYEIYINFFNCLNDTTLNEGDFTLFNLMIPKIALCANEFKEDSGNKIIQNIEEKFRGFNKEINFTTLCQKISAILKKEENSNDANKLLYLQIVNIVYNSQKFLYFEKNDKNPIEENNVFKNLLEVFDKIKNENVKIKFSLVFASLFNDFSEEENEKFVKKYEKLIKDNENNIYIIMSQLLRFRMSLPLYIQDFISKLKNICKQNESKKSIINSFMKIAMDNYHGSYIYMKNNISQKCRDTLEEMTIEKSYFV